MVEQLKYIPWRVLPASHQNCLANCSSYISNPMVMLPFSRQQKGWKVSQETCRSNPTYWDMARGKFESIDEKNIPHGVNQWLGYNLTFHFGGLFQGAAWWDFQICFHVGREAKEWCIVVPSAKVKVQSVFFGCGSTQSIKPWLVV